MQILGLLISLLTFPGVMLHEFSHKLFCNLTGVKVLNVCYFRLSDPIGYVAHEKPERFSQSFFITVGPLLINSTVAILSFLLSVLSLIYGSGLVLFFVWFGGSMAIHAFPSTGDANILWEESKRHIHNNLLAVIGFPVVVIIYLANILSMFWFDFAYAVGLYFLVLRLML